MRPPSFTRKLKDQTINDGEQLELTVKVDGDPEPQITWTKGGKVNKIARSVTPFLIIVIIYLNNNLFYADLELFRSHRSQI